MALEEGMSLIQAFCYTFYISLSELRRLLRSLIFWFPLGIFMSIFTLFMKLYALHIHFYRQTLLNVLVVRLIY